MDVLEPEPDINYPTIDCRSLIRASLRTDWECDVCGTHNKGEPNDRGPHLIRTGWAYQEVCGPCITKVYQAIKRAIRGGS
jgi:hypothetical protein